MVQHRILTGSGTLTIPAGVTSFTATGSGGRMSSTTVNETVDQQGWIKVYEDRIDAPVPGPAYPAPVPDHPGVIGEVASTYGVVFYQDANSGLGGFLNHIAHWQWTRTGTVTIPTTVYTAGGDTYIWNIPGGMTYTFPGESTAVAYRTDKYLIGVPGISSFNLTYSVAAGGTLTISW